MVVSITDIRRWDEEGGCGHHMFGDGLGDGSGRFSDGSGGFNYCAANGNDPIYVTHNTIRHTMTNCEHAYCGLVLFDFREWLRLGTVGINDTTETNCMTCLVLEARNA